MKQIITALFIGVFSFISTYIKGQDNLLAKKVITEANKQKTGNWQDVFTNFFQVAVKDLTGDTKSFDFKSTLFALRTRLDPSLNVDTNYVKYAFDRNFQFNTSLKLDSQYKFKAFSLGFSLCIINKRDSTILSFIGKEEDLLFKYYANDISDALNAYRQTAPKEKYNEAQIAVQTMLAKGKIILNNLPEEFRTLCSKKIEENFNSVSSALMEAIKDARTKPLLTLTTNAGFKKGKGLFNGGETELAYLQGLTKNKRPVELDFRLNFKAIDTVVNNKRYRTEIGFVGGFNWGIITSTKNYNPILEIKPHIEYKRITRGLLQNEKENTFTANATARIRVLKGLWIPLTLKYDLKNKHFLGFLNVSFNWDAFKKDKSE